jgi:hypothetical protein
MPGEQHRQRRGTPGADHDHVIHADTSSPTSPPGYKSILQQRMNMSQRDSPGTMTRLTKAIATLPRRLTASYQKQLEENRSPWFGFDSPNGKINTAPSDLDCRRAPARAAMGIL